MGTYFVICTNPAKSAAIEGCEFSCDEWPDEQEAMQQFATDYGLQLSEVAVEI
jgi:hypothetical protein